MNHPAVSLLAAQQDLNRAYVGGAPGVFVSGLVWLIAGTVWQLHGTTPAFIALFVGGIAIHPVAGLIEHSVFAAPRATAGRVFGMLGIEAMVPLFTGLMIAWVLLARAPDLAIPVAAATIGARYFLFSTMYGNIAYWVLGGAILLVASLALFGLGLPFNLGFLVGAIELVSAGWLLQQWRARR
jgi:hypothetical protein